MHHCIAVLTWKSERGRASYGCTSTTIWILTKRWNLPDDSQEVTNLLLAWILTPTPGHQPSTSTKDTSVRALTVIWTNVLFRTQKPTWSCTENTMEMLLSVPTPRIAVTPQMTVTSLINRPLHWSRMHPGCPIWMSARTAMWLLMTAGFLLQTKMGVSSSHSSPVLTVITWKNKTTMVSPVPMVPIKTMVILRTTSRPVAT